MTTESCRSRELLEMLTHRPDDFGAERLCEVCAREVEMSGAGIMMMSGDIQRGSLCTTNPVSALIEELQFSLGEGPCLDAFRLDRPVLEPDLAAPADVRWMAFSSAALDAGVAAIFGFPIHVGAVKFGALNLYRDRPGALTGGQHADALMLADLVARSMVMTQAHATPGQLAHELEDGAELELVVHQASGMVALQLGVSVAQALIRLQAYAFGNELSLRSVARDVVGRVLRFDDSSEPVDAEKREG